MKICPNCQQKYTDDNLNFCLTDGGILTNFDDAPPTILLNKARTTNQNWSTTDPASAWDNQPLAQQPQNQAFINPSWKPQGNDQTLPILALVLGCASLLLICCYGGFYFGIAAIIVGFIGMNNANNNPSVYGGKGFAVAGLILGGISFVITLLMILVAIAV